MNLSKGYLLTLVVLFGVLSVLLVAPFLQYVLLAILLAYVLIPVQRRLATRIGPRLASASLIVLAFVGFIIPFAVVIGAVAGDALTLLRQVDGDLFQIGGLEEQLQRYTGTELELSDFAGSAGGSGQDIGMTILQQTTALFGTAVHALLGLGLSIFLLYYFLKDGHQFRSWLEETTPLPTPVQNDLYGAIHEVMWATLFGHVLVAVIQGVIAGLGLFATGIPNAMFWTFVMVVLAILPLIGAFLVWGPAAVYLALTGEPLLGVALFIYGTIVVGLTDDYLRPILVDRRADLSPAVIILGVLGGAYAFGVMGLFFGPVILGALKATLTVVSDHYDRLEATVSR